MITFESMTAANRLEMRMRRIERADRVVSHLRDLQSKKLPTATLAQLKAAAGELRQRYGLEPQNQTFRQL